VRQYEIWWAELPVPVGRRPVLLLTRGAGYGYLNKAIVVEITTTIRAIPQELPVGSAEGLPVDSVANFDNVHVVPLRCLSARLGAVSRRRIPEVKRALGYALDWPELKVL
jgi:mRNA interferase MazF